MLRVGIAGYGVVGKRRKECLDLNPNVEVVALSDKLLDVGHDPRADVKKFQNYVDLLSEKLDLLFVCLTNDWLLRSQSQRYKAASTFSVKSRPEKPLKMFSA